MTNNSLGILKRINIVWFHIIVAAFLFTTTSVVWGGAISFFGNLPEPSPFDPLILTLGWMHVYAIWPIIIYIVFFTRPYLPFRKKQKGDSV